jgi:hypothetical protein
MTTELSASLLVVCGFLVAVSIIQRYASNFIIPGVTIMMFIGAISVIVPVYSSDFKTVYDSIVNKAPDLILLVIIPLLIFESARKLKLEEIRKQIVPIGFFAIIGSNPDHFSYSSRCQYYLSPDYPWNSFWFDTGSDGCGTCSCCFRDFRYHKG